MTLSSSRHLLIAFLAAFLVAGCAGTSKPVEPTGARNDVAQAIDSAKAAVAQAAGLDALWRDTESFLKSAEEAAASGDNETALKLANKARSEAEMAVNQHYLEKAKVLYAKASAAGGVSAAQQSTMVEAAEAIRNGEGRKAYDLLVPLVAELGAASMQYNVAGGDSLWSISGQEGVYNNPYQWPLIYKANRDQISDADLIYPGQIFSVDLNPSSTDASAAVNHARNRGAWSVGVVEETDRNYLGGTVELR
ncbi:MAG: LysM peptidoglycan-binding domain-containing protein [Thiogranum sp.]|nr:LysM peptidoglycan-binding domain-containing protein [Thiogranum sp.]